MGWLSRLTGAQQRPEVPFVEVTDDNFKGEVLEQDKPVMLFVWSNTCPHCKKMAPNVKEAADLHAEAIKAAHTNSGLSPKLMDTLGVRGVPVTFFIQNSKVVERVVGFRPVSYLDELIQSLFLVQDPAEAPAQEPQES